jgi:Holliday junction resolvase RusA-like endonuclease
LVVSPISVSVSGSPAILSGDKATADTWKEAVARAVAAKHMSGYIKEPCGVHFTFNVMPSRFRDTALFNLLKSTIDGLSNVVFAASPSGQPGKWSREDWRITELLAFKKQVNGSPSTEIAIEPIGATLGQISGFRLPDAFVPGKVPPLPGGSVGQDRVNEWRREFVNHLSMSGLATSSTRIAISFLFLIEQSRMLDTDIDNLCVPACQAVCHALYGDLRHGQNVVALHAVKALAHTYGELGTRVRIWLV